MTPLRQDLLSGRFTKQELVKRHGVSRYAVRKAADQLKSEGHVVPDRRIPKGGYSRSTIYAEMANRKVKFGPSLLNHLTKAQVQSLAIEVRDGGYTCANEFIAELILDHLAEKGEL